MKADMPALRICASSGLQTMSASKEPVGQNFIIGLVADKTLFAPCERFDIASSSSGKF
jgi:hypothetical protein